MGTEEFITQAEAARKYGVTPSYISKIVKQGKLTKVNGKLIVADVSNFFGVLNEQPDELDYAEARRRKLIIEMRIKEMELEEMRGDLIRLSEVHEVISMIFIPINRFLDDLPHRTKTQFPADFSTEAMQWMGNEINQMKIDLQKRPTDAWET